MKVKAILWLIACYLCVGAGFSFAEDGYEMWLRYQPVTDAKRLKDYRKGIERLVVEGDSPQAKVVAQELARGLSGLLAEPIKSSSYKKAKGVLLVGTPKTSELIRNAGLDAELNGLGDEGYLIKSIKLNKKDSLVIAANTDTALIYGAFHFLRLLQTQSSIENLAIISKPKLQYRVVNHWDNLNRLVERGYAGLSLWEWGTLPEYIHPRYIDYARINASLGINGTVLNNVNADPRMLSDQFIHKVAALAEAFRPYGIKVYVSLNYNAPRGFGDLETADPLDPRVRDWWKKRIDKIYSIIPDFGGFLVKADSEGQPGPQGYGRNHADGANMLAEAVKPYGGVIFWRAFVYSPDIGDRFRGAYDEFKPLDGKFDENVILQIKNGPIDFQPREPYSPLFAAMENTNMMMEFQVSQEYFGFNTHLAYQGTLFEESLRTNTHAKGKKSEIGDILEGKIYKHSRTGMAAVVNPGTDRNWTGHPFVQSSWYSFGRFAWDHQLTAEAIAEEWSRMTFTNDEKALELLKKIMMVSREAGVNYRNPLGLTHLYQQGDHYGPAPWTDDMPRADWNAIYYHRADADGIGFNRTKTGSNALAQYPKTLSDIYGDLNQVPEELMLWFHHVNWDHKMKSGRTMWEELVHKYYEGVDQVRQMQKEWNQLEGKIDADRFAHVKALLKIQEGEAVRWRDSCVVYFQSISKRPIPAGLEKPAHDLEYYKKLSRINYIPDPWHPAGNSRKLK